MASDDYAQAQCRLLRLPPELRNKIYEMVFYMPQGVCVVKPPWYWRVAVAEVRKRRIDFPNPKRLALLQTCRHIRDETEGVFYGINALKTDDYPGHFLIRDFIQATSAARLKSITRFSTGCIPTCSFIDDLTVVCDSMPRLKQLRLGFFTEFVFVHEYERGGKELMEQSLGKLYGLETLEFDFFGCKDAARVEVLKAELDLMFLEVKARRTMEGGDVGGGCAA
ncbi:hypothetical protein LTR37_016589 [Vermiconidia calcicola]|uniref:Uncharacterized protein n=1 Tax=Vermiconidia calcicola TaxID=1690605 RepID=A0ACC3MMD8_9PEZI|nr:hypothetical protein LTR37_016589 [Vermiconidia calcicola]